MLQNLPYIYHKKTHVLFCFSFRATLFFPLMNAPAAVYVDIDPDQGTFFTSEQWFEWDHKICEQSIVWIIIGSWTEYELKYVYGILDLQIISKRAKKIVILHHRRPHLKIYGVYSKKVNIQNLYVYVLEVERTSKNRTSNSPNIGRSNFELPEHLALKIKPNSNIWNRTSNFYRVKKFLHFMAKKHNSEKKIRYLTFCQLSGQ